MFPLIFCVVVATMTLVGGLYINVLSNRYRKQAIELFDQYEKNDGWLDQKLATESYRWSRFYDKVFEIVVTIGFVVSALGLVWHLAS
jgi:hypothetical protein